MFNLFMYFRFEFTGLKCQEGLQNILENNAPQVLVVPFENDLNTFSPTKIQLR